MIAASTLDPESVGLVKDYVNELLRYAASPLLPRYELSKRHDRWMVKEKDRIFQWEYDNASSIYISLSAS
jgi:mortality factor 4-like protein 1